MHRTLWLIRHAKAAAAEFGQADDQRPLAPSGVADVANLVSHLAEESTAPVQWLWQSPALRTQQTAEPLTTLWHCESVENESLYISDPFTLLHCLQATPPDYQHAALVGHNPGLSQLAHYLVDETGQRAMDIDLPTLGVVQMNFQGDWHDLRPRACSVQRYLKPSLLAADR